MEVIIHRGEIIQCIADHPVCHSCSCDSNTVLCPVFLLPCIRKAVTKFLIHDPCDSICRSHAAKHMRMTVFSFFDYILFVGCKIKSAGFANRIWYLAGSLTQTGDCIIETTWRNPLCFTPCSIS